MVIDISLNFHVIKVIYVAMNLTSVVLYHILKNPATRITQLNIL